MGLSRVDNSPLKRHADAVRRDTVEITLAPEQQQIVKRLMDSGGYRDPDAVVTEALRIIEEEHDFEPTMPEAMVAAELQAGVGQLDRGEGVVLQSEDEVDAFFEDIESRGRQRLAARTRAEKP